MSLLNGVMHHIRTQGQGVESSNVDRSKGV